MNKYTLLAKQAIESYIKEGIIIEPPKDLPEEFFKRMAGTFVTLEKNNELMGCIGTYLPTKINIAEEIIHNAVSASTEDYRFESIKKEDLPHLSHTVYVLNYPEPVKDIKELDPKKYGVIVRTGPLTFPNEKEIDFDGELPYKTGLLLPGLDGINTIEEQIYVACQKGGINHESEKIFIYKFSAEKYEERQTEEA